VNSIATEIVISKSGDLGAHRTGLPRPIHRFGNLWFKNIRIIRA